MASTAPQQSDHVGVDHVDIAIIGAGMSGIGTAIDLQLRKAGKSFVLLEARQAIGGTWDLFRYPGVRSDSDVQTFSFGFKPWDGNTMIAPGGEILSYVREAAAEHDINRHIRFGHKVRAADWNSATQQWTLSIELVDADGAVTGTTELTANWIFNAAGYYRYDKANEPELPGRENFRGRIVHPQYWPEDLDYTGKRVVVLGSGATAVTLLPSMAKDAASVTMLQRTPTYLFPLPEKAPLAGPLRRVLGAKRAHAVLRRIHIAFQASNYALLQKFPTFGRLLFRRIARHYLGKDYPVEVHFNPPYNPWDQRVCVIPDADFYKSVAAGEAEIVTDTIDHLTADGIALRSGRELPCDLLITATGFLMQSIGGMELSVDGQAKDVGGRMAYKGVMLDEVPNFLFAVGYTNSSWTLKIGLVSAYFARLLKYMDEHGYRSVTPMYSGGREGLHPMFDFGAGYVQRAAHKLPQVGEFPWATGNRYVDDRRVLVGGEIDDAALEFAA